MVAAAAIVAAAAPAATTGAPAACAAATARKRQDLVAVAPVLCISGTLAAVGWGCVGRLGPPFEVQSERRRLDNPHLVIIKGPPPNAFLVRRLIILIVGTDLGTNFFIVRPRMSKLLVLPYSRAIHWL